MNDTNRGCSLTEISGKFGTAYDFFISLYVLTQPDRFGLRPSWAAGVRSRLPLEQRKFLEETLDIIPVPFGWLNQPDWQPKDAATALAVMAAMPASERLPALLSGRNSSPSARQAAERIQQVRSYTSEDLEDLRGFFQKRVLPVKQKTLLFLAESLSNVEHFGQQMLNACQV